ncbi:MAG: hypothetical protein AB7P20_09120 [Rhizobiaceae bacterium]
MLATLIANIASGEALLAFRRAKVTFIVYALCAFLALIGFVFLLVGAYLYAAAHFGPIDAAAAFGAGFIGLGLLILIVFKLTTRARRRRATERRKGELATVVAASALALLPALANRKSASTLLIAPLLGILGYRIYKENSRGPKSPPAEPDE